MNNMSAKNRFALVVTMATAVVITYAALKCFQPFVLAASLIKPWLTRSFYLPLAGLFKHTLISPEFYVVVALTLLLQKLFPADPKQKSFNISLAQDIVWFVYETLLNAIVITTYVYVLKEIYRQHFNFLTIEAAAQWPAWLRFMSGVLLLDLLFWLQHYLNHKVPLLWRFHAVHHSQKALNFFTDYRYHIVEYIVRHTVVVIPFLVLEVSVPEIVAFSFFKQWYTRCYHANIRLNLGVLRYMVVTPQSHRVHHSVMAQHRDTNFGALFSIWDYLFGTQYRGYNEYPETGIEDETFPHEKEARLPRLILVPFIQMAHAVHPRHKFF